MTLVVGYDGSAGSRAAYAQALELAGRLGEGVHVVFSFESPRLGGELADLDDAIRERGEKVDRRGAGDRGGRRRRRVLRRSHAGSGRGPDRGGRRGRRVDDRRRLQRRAPAEVRARRLDADAAAAPAASARCWWCADPPDPVGSRALCAQWSITKAGDPSVLKVEERPDPPAPGPGQVTIAVARGGRELRRHDGARRPLRGRAAAAGRRRLRGRGDDHRARRRRRPGAPVGQRVMAGTRFGGYAEQVVVTASDAIPLPDSLSFEQGAAIPVNYATAWAGLLGYGSLRAGERVLIHAAAGGVGIAATQLGQARRRRGPRHRVAGQARGAGRSGRRPRDRLPPRRLVRRTCRSTT